MRRWAYGVLTAAAVSAGLLWLLARPAVRVAAAPSRLATTATASVEAYPRASASDLVGTWRPVLTASFEQRLREAHRRSRSSRLDEEATIRQVRETLARRAVEIDGTAIRSSDGDRPVLAQPYRVRAVDGSRIHLRLDAADGGLPEDVVVRVLNPARIAMKLPTLAPDSELELEREER